MTPKQYELEVKRIIDAAGSTLDGYTSEHLESIEGSDGDYKFDVTARFSALGADFLVLIECKHEKRKIERQAVQVLHSKLQAVGAQKGILFSISGFQAGAIRFADSHGIELVHMANGESNWVTKSMNLPQFIEQDQNLGFLGRWSSGSLLSLISAQYPNFAREHFGVPNQRDLE